MAADEQDVLTALEDGHPTYPPDPLARVRRLEAAVRRIAALLQNRVASGQNAVTDVSGRVDELDQRLAVIEARLLIVSTLPATAPFGALIRLQGDLTGNLYLGNGANRPLSKLTPSPL